MMIRLRVLWVEDDLKFPPSIHFRVEDELRAMGVELEAPEILQDGKFVSDTVRDWKPDLIMMDHNLEDVLVNGANLVIEVRFQNNETPIIYYSSEMGPMLMNMVKGEHEVYTTTRTDVAGELVRLIKRSFLP